MPRLLLTAAAAFAVLLVAAALLLAAGGKLTVAGLCFLAASLVIYFRETALTGE